MIDEELPWDTTPIHKTKILPLRWFGNAMNHASSPFLWKAIYESDKIADSDSELSRKGKFYWWLYSAMNAPYEKWGTTYKMDWHR